MREKFGVGPASIPDYLALVGDTADGFPGLPGFGAKTASAVLARYGTSRTSRRSAQSGTSPDCATSPASPRRSPRTSSSHYLFRRIATIECDVEVGAVDEWLWRGPTARFATTCEKLGSKSLAGRAARAGKGR